MTSESHSSAPRFVPNEKRAALFDRLDPATALHVHFRERAFREQHLDDLARAEIAEELPELFLVERDPMLFDQRDEILRRVARQGRGAKARITGEKIFRRSEKVGEVAAAAAGDRDFQSDACVVLEQGDAPPAPPGG